MCAHGFRYKSGASWRTGGEQSGDEIGLHDICNSCICVIVSNLEFGTALANWLHISVRINYFMNTLCLFHAWLKCSHCSVWFAHKIIIHRSCQVLVCCCVYLSLWIHNHFDSITMATNNGNGYDDGSTFGIAPPITPHNRSPHTSFLTRSRQTANRLPHF